MVLKTTKSSTIFRCQECGHSSAKWMGKCPDCGKWNTFAEEKQILEPTRGTRRALTDFTSPVSLMGEISSAELRRMETGIREFDRIMGGGIVPGSLILLGGPPGIGKSTLMLQVADRLSRSGKVLYVSGEESREQIKGRADRLSMNGNGSGCKENLFVLSETSLENILEQVKKVSPEALIVDSIQTTYRSDLISSPGSVGQVRECASEFLKLAKAMGLTVFLLGHVTKEGDLAGPRVLEHIVDTVLYFEAEKHQFWRVLRAHKNRFGPTSEIGIFEMTSSGLAEVKNPSELFLNGRSRAPGSVLVSAIEGSRPLVLEIQALLARSYYGLPRRMVTGVDFNRVLLLTAVLEKRLGLNLSSQDIFVNVTGGVKVKEPACDLGVACAMISAFGNFSLNSDGVFIGEVGLGGEVRPVPQILSRVMEAQRLGLSWAIVPNRGWKEGSLGNHGQEKMKAVPVENLNQAMNWLKSQHRSL